MTHRAIELLNEQQRNVKERSAPWMVAEQLKDLCRREPESAELLAKDLENPSMGIVQAEKRIKAFADAHPGSAYGHTSSHPLSGDLQPPKNNIGSALGLWNTCRGPMPPL